MTAIHQRLPMRLFTGRHLPAVVDVDWMYRTEDPYAIELSVPAAQDTAAVWLFARDLLATGLHTPAGDGDVHIAPAEDEGRAEEATTLIAFGTPRQGYVLLEAPTGQLNGFLDRSFAAVPRGEEARRLDWTACIESLLND